jgi:hypothetical protein
MKRQVLTLVGVLSLLLAAGSAYAQSIRVKADVPFDFIVDQTTLSSGQYTLETLSPDRVLLIRGSDGKAIAMVVSNGIESTKPAEHSKLVFQRYGGRYFLSQIWVQGNNAGHQLRKSAREREMARNSRPQEAIVMALLK